MHVDLNKIKLIIWDLDDTFWKGTLSEQKVTPIAENIEVIDTLTKRGIINSICSKNDSLEVKKEFEKPVYKNIFHNFVFNSIDWSPKGLRIKAMIENMQLRAENVLFIDDNNSNLEEAKFYCKDLKIASPSIIGDIIKAAKTIGKDDSNLTRLNQYKILETKNKKRLEANSNEEFLKNSAIQVFISHDCLNAEERILELLTRTNQMNFTKIRLGKEELHSLLTNENYENAFIKVKDNFGAYGIVGFYSLDKRENKLLHFLFSCRILGMGIDQAVYQKLNYPTVHLQGDISSKLENEPTVNWVEFIKHDFEEEEKLSSSSKILFKGPCDLDSVVAYLKGVDVDTEFIHTNQNSPDTIAQQCLTNIVNSHKYSHNECLSILEQAPVLAKDDFDTNLFKKQYDIVFLSTLLEGQIPLYKHKEKNYLIPFGIVDYPFVFKKNWEFLKSNCWFSYNVKFTDALLEKLSEDFEYVGLPTTEDILSNVLYIRENLNPKTKLILILGPEIEFHNEQVPGYSQCAKRYREINAVLKKELATYKNIDFINITDFIESQSDFTDCNNHFSRSVYFKLAKKVKSILSDYTKDLSFSFSTQSLNKELKELRRKLFAYQIKKFLVLNKKKHYTTKIEQVRKHIVDLENLLKNINI